MESQMKLDAKKLGYRIIEDNIEFYCCMENYPDLQEFESVYISGTFNGWLFTGDSSWLLKKTQEKIKRHTMKYPFEQSKIASINHNDGFGGMVDKDAVLGNPTPIEFEGKTLMGMKDNDAYLTQLFGDYMTPPPEDKIHTHNFFFLDLEHPYKDYDKSKVNQTW